MAALFGRSLAIQTIRQTLFGWSRRTSSTAVETPARRAKITAIESTQCAKEKRPSLRRAVQILVGRRRIELRTNGLRVRCSTS